MPLTKRLKDAMKEFLASREELKMAEQVLTSAQLGYNKVSKKHQEKVSLVMGEVNSCIPSNNGGPPEISLEVDGTQYLVTTRPYDSQAKHPTYIREIRTEK